MHAPMINPALAQYAAAYREAELERAWKHRRDIPRARRGLPLIAWGAVAAAVQRALFPAPPFGVERALQVEAAAQRLR